MNDDSQMYDDMSEIRDGDILFNCPYCGKSMTIDAAGAGLIVPCANCGKEVQVPIPDVSTPEVPVSPSAHADMAEQDPMETIHQLDAALAMANQQIDQLMAEKEALQERRAFLEQIRIGSSTRLEQIGHELNGMQDTLDRVLVLLADAKAEKPV
ncbi:MAG: hypothetical protein LBN38_08695 [Verrucomicrobiota bacterium]|jgi:transcription elongation factor Elf1|nr:hypothetical protein [Verrucomicrobiota bacterium]